MAGAPTPAESVNINKRRAEAVRLRNAGKTWQEVADAIGYGSRAAAYVDVARARAAAYADMRDSVQEMRDRELADLDMLHDAAAEVLLRYHLIVSGGKIIRDGIPIIDTETGEAIISEGAGEPLVDDGPVLAAIDRLIKIAESRRKLLGLDSPTKIEAAGTVHYVIEGPNGPVDLDALK